MRRAPSRERYRQEVERLQRLVDELGLDRGVARWINDAEPQMLRVMALPMVRQLAQRHLERSGGV